MIDGDEVIDVFAVAEGVLGFDDDVLVNGFVVVRVTAMVNGAVFEFELNPMVMFDMLYSSVVFISIVVFWCVLVPNVVSLILVKPVVMLECDVTDGEVMFEIIAAVELAAVIFE